MDENVNENNNEKEEGTVPSDEVVIQQATSEAQSAVVTITSSGLRGHWGKLIAVAVALTGFLGWYDTVRNQGALFMCDVAEVVGYPTSDACAPDIEDLSKQLADLKAREHLLTDEQRTNLHELDSALAQLAYVELIENSAKRGIEVGSEASESAAAAVQEVAESDNALEELALQKIAAGDVDGGLQLLAEAAQGPTREAVERLRRLGSIAYLVDTERALEAYRMVVFLDPTKAWDSIYLARLNVRIGALDEAREAVVAALDQPIDDERDKSALLNELGYLQRWQGDLDAALVSYESGLEIARTLAERDPSDAQWQRDLYVSLWTLASFPISGVTWDGVVAQLESMEAMDTLFPGDVRFLEQARRNQETAFGSAP